MIKRHYAERLHLIVDRIRDLLGVFSQSGASNLTGISLTPAVHSEDTQLQMSDKCTITGQFQDELNSTRRQGNSDTTSIAIQSTNPIENNRALISRENTTVSENHASYQPEAPQSIQGDSLSSRNVDYLVHGRRGEDDIPRQQRECIEIEEIILNLEGSECSNTLHEDEKEANETEPLRIPIETDKALDCILQQSDAPMQAMAYSLSGTSPQVQYQPCHDEESKTGCDKKQPLMIECHEVEPWPTPSLRPLAGQETDILSDQTNGIGKILPDDLMHQVRSASAV